MFKSLIVLGASVPLLGTALAAAQPAPPVPPVPPPPSSTPADAPPSAADEAAPAPSPVPPAGPAPAPQPAPATQPESQAAAPGQASATPPAPTRPPSEDIEDPASDPPASRQPPPGQPVRPIPDRSGATFEASFGIGVTQVSLDSGLSDSFGGLSGLNLGLGGWISPRTALTLRIAGTSFVQPVDGVDVRFIAGLIGLSMQYMSDGGLWGGVGLGVGVLTTDQENIESMTGFGLDLRAGVNLYQSAESAVHLALEITPGVYDGLNVTGVGLQLGWQSF